MNNQILRAINLNKKFNNSDNPTVILNDINLSIHSGEIILILGKSGAGKSTLLYALSGLLKPDEGSVLICQKPIYSLSDKDRSLFTNKKIGFVFQDYALLDYFSVLENIMLPLELNNKFSEKSQNKENAIELLKTFQVDHRMNSKPSSLSGGEKQRVAIIRAIINNPEIVFCDEPTGNLDSSNTKIFIDTIKKLNEIHKQTFIIVSHDHELSSIATTIYQINDGKLTKT
jgi:ABC-type lipoprotein export system ATPase subunit